MPLRIDPGLDPARIPVASADARVVWHPEYAMAWFGALPRAVLWLVTGGGHAATLDRFPALSASLVAGGVIGPADVAIPEPASRAELRRVHTAGHLAHIDRLLGGWPLERGLLRPGENKLSRPLWRFIEAGCGGTYRAATLALEHGVGVNLAGGAHHAFPDHEEGFCFIHDVAVALERLFAEGRVARALVIDLDTHHGNGTAAIYRDRDEVAIVDVYERYNYPADKIPVTHPVPLLAGTGDDEYLDALAFLPDAVAAARPDIAFYLAGADPFVDDTLGQQQLTMDGLARRDAFVFDTLEAAGVPCAVVLAGGYSPLEALVAINHRTVALALGRRGGV